MKTILLFGNGFNKLIANLVTSYPEDKIPKGLNTDLSVIARNINHIAVLCERFSNTFPKVKNTNPQLCDEQIFCLLSDLYNEEIFKEVIPSDTIEELKKRIDAARKNSLKEVAIDFKRFENISGNKAIRQLFPNFGVAFEKILNHNGIEEAFICTTNYDGILDTLLTYPFRINGTNFIFPDGFGWSNIAGHLKLYEHKLRSAKRCMVHLHGFYRFTKQEGNTYKITGDISNEEPVLVFNNPFLKEKEIYDDQVLSTYYKLLIEKLKIYDRVVIIGNSFRNEPHLEELIKNYFDRSNTELVICSLELQNYYRQNIYQFTTKDVTTEGQLFKLLYQLLTPNIMNSYSCINKGLAA